MKRTIYLARHGETDWNRERRWQGQSDIALNEVGRAQARALAASLERFGITQVGASDLSRATETARIVADAFALTEIGLDPGLRERGFGVFEGLTQEECSERYPEHWANYCAVKSLPPGAEPIASVAARFREALLRYHARHIGGESLLLVSHGSAIRVFIESVTGQLPPPMANGATYRVTVAESRFLDVESVR